MDNNDKLQDTQATTASDTAAQPVQAGTGALPAAAAVAAAVAVPDGVKVLSNGSWVKDGRFIKGPDQPPINSENAAQIRALYEQRRLQARVAAQESLSSLDVSRPTIMGGWMKIIENQAGFAATERSLAAVSAARFVGAATGFVSERGADAPGSASVTVTLGTDALHTLLDACSRRLDAGAGDVIDAEFTE
jgi:hypothetical protein